MGKQQFLLLAAFWFVGFFFSFYFFCYFFLYYTFVFQFNSIIMNNLLVSECLNSDYIMSNVVVVCFFSLYLHISVFQFVNWGESFSLGSPIKLHLFTTPICHGNLFGSRETRNFLAQKKKVTPHHHKVTGKAPVFLPSNKLWKFDVDQAELFHFKKVHLIHHHHIMEKSLIFSTLKPNFPTPKISQVFLEGLNQKRIGRVYSMVEDDV